MIEKHTAPNFAFGFAASALAALMAVALSGCTLTETQHADIRVLGNPRVGVQKLPSDTFGAALIKEEWQFVVCQECKVASPSGKLVWLIVSTDKKWEPIEEEGDEQPETSAGVPGKAVKRFAFDSAKVTGDVSGLEAVLKALKSNAAAKIQITGFTDSVGNPKYNLALSRKRAQTVADWFAKNGVPRERMSVAGKGEQSPVSDNGTEGGRAENRRSETVVSVEVIGS